MKVNSIFTVITTIILEGTSTVIADQTVPGMVLREIKSSTDLVRLPCNISEADSYRWNRFFAALQSNGFESKNHSLVIDQVSYKDSGLYGCTGCNGSSCESFNVTLEVLHTISEESMLNKTVLVDGEVEFDCSLRFEPIFSYKVEFYKFSVIDRHDLKLLSNLTKLHSNFKKSLKLENVQFENSGWYSCVINHMEFFNFDNSEVFYNINNYVAFKTAYLQVLESPKQFEINQPHSQTTPKVVGIVSGVFIFLVFLAALTYKQLKQKKKYYQRWFKTVTVTRPPIGTDSETFQMPSIRIESKRSIEVMNDDYEFAPVLEYEFPIDWDFEFPREKLTLGKKLGEGAFGKVFMAYADGLLQEGVTSTVAVKMLKDEYSDTEVLDLVCELEIMKIVGKHPNVVNLLGSCAQYGPLYVIMEFAVHGNLKDFLRGHTLKTEDDLHGAKTLTMKQLVAFGLQIAAGMQYLSSLKFIHRDLAARNILVSEGFTMKITDFGLARDVHNQDYYRKKTSGKLPIRWMAPESLEERFFDTKTDVWSFGVLLWEIITLGRTPYRPAFSWEHLLEFLKKGNRLEKPDNCPDGLYNIMRECWQFEARERPTFDQLRASIDRLIDNFEESSGYCTLVDSESVV